MGNSAVLLTVQHCPSAGDHRYGKSPLSASASVFWEGRGKNLPLLCSSSYTHVVSAQGKVNAKGWGAGCSIANGDKRWEAWLFFILFVVVLQFASVRAGLRRWTSCQVGNLPEASAAVFPPFGTRCQCCSRNGAALHPSPSVGAAGVQR